jgi:hypothetical protein
MPTKKILGQMRWGAMHLGNSSFFSFGGGWGCWIFFLLCVPIKFPNGFSTCFQCVPQHVLNSFSFYPISFALSSTLVNYITSLKEKITTYLFWDSFQSLISFSLYPISFALSSTLVNYITSLKEKITTYLFWDSFQSLIDFFVMGH